MQFRILMIFVLAFSFAGAYGQAVPKKTREDASRRAGAVPTARELAKKAVLAHGGRSFSGIKTLLISGTVDITVSSFQQAFPASFSTAFAAEKYVLEINSQFASFRQSFDGENTSTSPERGFELPPINRIGLALLQRAEMPGFEVTELPEKKKYGFRIVSPEGYFSDFYLNRKTFLVKGYDATYIVSGREASTSVKIKKYVVKEGAKIPSRYDQRFDFGGLIVYASFKSREVLVNTGLSEDLFSP